MEGSGIKGLGTIKQILALAFKMFVVDSAALCFTSLLFVPSSVQVVTNDYSEGESGHMYLHIISFTFINHLGHSWSLCHMCVIPKFCIFPSIAVIIFPKLKVPLSLCPSGGATMQCLLWGMERREGSVVVGKAVHWRGHVLAPRVIQSLRGALQHQHWHYRSIFLFF